MAAGEKEAKDMAMAEAKAKAMAAAEEIGERAEKVLLFRVPLERRPRSSMEIATTAILMVIGSAIAQFWIRRWPHAGRRVPVEDPRRRAPRQRQREQWR